jgi:hypothetical protein
MPLQQSAGGAEFGEDLVLIHGAYVACVGRKE